MKTKILLIVTLFFVQASLAQTGINVTTFAGALNSNSGYVNAPGNSARFDLPSDVVMDNAGNIYVSERNNRRIRKITPAGVVTTFCGSGLSGTTDGGPTVARFQNINRMVMHNGNIYLTDGPAGTIRKVTSAGVVSTFYSGLSSPFGIAINGGFVYVSESSKHIITRVSLSTGIGGIVAGTPFSAGSQTGTASSAKFNSPRGLAFTSGGNLLIVDNGNRRIRMWFSFGHVANFSGSGTYGTNNGSASSCQYIDPVGITPDGLGGYYVTDGGGAPGNYVHKVAGNGAKSSFAGVNSAGHVNGMPSTAKFSSPAGMIVDANGVLYIADGDNHAVRRIGPSSTLPVELLNFKVQSLKEKVQLQWQTAQEQHNSHFNIQRSTDGTNFETIGATNSKAENGNSNLKIDYEFIDDNPHYGANDYRLEQVDMDGKASFSDIKRIDFFDTQELSIWPNPIKNNLHLNLENAQVRIYDLMGKVLIQSKQKEIDVSTLASGIYILKAIKNNQEYQSKFMKE